MKTEPLKQTQEETKPKSKFHKMTPLLFTEDVAIFGVSIAAMIILIGGVVFTVNYYATPKTRKIDSPAPTVVEKKVDSSNKVNNTPTKSTDSAKTTLPVQSSSVSGSEPTNNIVTNPPSDSAETDNVSELVVPTTSPEGTPEG